MKNIATHFLRAKDGSGNEVTIVRRGQLAPSAPRGSVAGPVGGHADGLHYELLDGQPLVEDQEGCLLHEATGRRFSDVRAGGHRGPSQLP